MATHVSARRKHEIWCYDFLGKSDEGIMPKTLFNYFGHSIRYHEWLEIIRPGDCIAFCGNNSLSNY